MSTSEEMDECDRACPSQGHSGSTSSWEGGDGLDLVEDRADLARLLGPGHQVVRVEKEVQVMIYLGIMPPGVRPLTHFT